MLLALVHKVCRTNQKTKKKTLPSVLKLVKPEAFFFLRWLVAIAKQRRLMQTTK